MMSWRNCRAMPARGFTLVELIMTVAIIGVLASAAFPLAELAVARAKERELQSALREIREAIDAYKRAADEGRIAKSITETGYPKSLGLLYRGFPDQKSPDKAMIYLLRRLPRDPMNPDTSISPEESWGRRSYASPPEDPRDGEDVFDVFTRALGVGLNGIAYREW
jgi:general secretion pathway protein G